jgi:3-dehydroquinate synthase
MIPHGHAVAAGLSIMARACEKFGWSEAGLATRITTCLSHNDLPIDTSFSAQELANAASADKKRAGNDITIVVPCTIGQCELKKLPVSDLLPLIKAGLEV